MKTCITLKNQINTYINIQNLNKQKYLLFTTILSNKLNNLSIICTKKILKINWLKFFLIQNKLRFPLYILYFNTYNEILNSIKKKNFYAIFLKSNSKIIKVKDINFFFFFNDFIKTIFYSTFKSIT